MLRIIVMTVVIAMALSTTWMHSETSAGSRIGGGSLPTDNVEVLGQDDEDDGPDCEWIAEQVRKVGSAYWKTRYYEECVSTIDD